jgi:uncharacterized protein YndB with AHSA1/START domain
MSHSSTDRIEKRIELKAPASRVWQALTSHEEFSQWFGVALESPFVLGETARGQVTHPGYEHMLLELVPAQMVLDRLFSYHWSPYDPDSDPGEESEIRTLVEFTLEEVPGGTLLVLVESGFDALPDEWRERAYGRNEGGWTQQMKSIEAHLGGRE